MTQDPSPAQRTLTAGILDIGTVNSQVIRLLIEQVGDFAAHSGARLETTGVAVRDTNASRDFAIPQNFLTGDATAAATGNDLVTEFIGEIKPARIPILTAFKVGINIIIDNRALIAAHGPELYIAVAAAGTDFYYEATIAGAIPVVYVLRESMAGDRATSVSGIADGVTSHILDEMSTKELSFKTAPAAIQEPGCAEADPIADVDGLDVVAKAAIITSLAFRTRVGFNDVSVEGIREVVADDIREAHASGCELKLLTITQCRDDEHTQGVFVHVHPALVPNDHPLASVHGTHNAVLVEAESAERLMSYGQGAGKAPTASAVLSDAVAAVAHRVHGGQAPRESPYASLRVLGPEAIVVRYRIQPRSDNAAGFLTAMASVFTEDEVSINSVRQNAYVASDSNHDQAVVTFVTRPTPVFHPDAAVKGLRDSDRVAEVISVQRVEGE